MADRIEAGAIHDKSLRQPLAHRARPRGVRRRDLRQEAAREHCASCCPLKRPDDSRQDHGHDESKITAYFSDYPRV